MMAASPFDHVMDSQRWEFFENFGLEFRLPTIRLPVYGDFHVTKFMILELIAALLVIAIYVPLARRAQSGDPPTGFFWNTFESILTFLRDRVAKPNIGEHDADRFLPFIWTVFLFVLFCNLLGMIPYMGSPTASITVTGVLALFAFVVIHGGAVAKMGIGGYLRSYVPHMEVPYGLGALIVPMIVVIEAIGHLIKTFVLAVRLFANMFAGHTVLAVILLFIVMAKDTGFFLFWPITISSVLGVTALSLLELFVAFLQAYIFAFLASLFLGMALHPQH
jgi:F-type H+-transporting ATPase subunit a